VTRWGWAATQSEGTQGRGGKREKEREREKSGTNSLYNNHGGPHTTAWLAHVDPLRKGAVGVLDEAARSIMGGARSPITSLLRQIIVCIIFLTAI